MSTVPSAPLLPAFRGPGAPTRRVGRRTGASLIRFRLSARLPDAAAARVAATLAAAIRNGDRVWRENDSLIVRLDGASPRNARRRAIALQRTLPRWCQVRFEVRAVDPPTRRDRVPSAASACAERSEPWWKRPLDVTGAIVGLVATAPVLVVAACLVKCTSPGPVLYRSWRIGKGGVPFRFVKFRTMVDGAERQQAALRHRNEMTGTLFKIKDDPRVTTVGRWLRRTSIDELPQLWNVLRGDMSLVGPRPATPDEVASYDAWHRERLSVQQGLTGLWQVEGRGCVGFPDSARMDIRYCRRRTLGGDLRLLLRTIGAVLRQRGAH